MTSDSVYAQVSSIERLKYRYWRASDAKDFDTFRGCFVRTGARIDYGPMGTFDDADALTEIFRGVALNTVDGRFAILDMHHGMHPDIPHQRHNCDGTLVVALSPGESARPYRDGHGGGSTTTSTWSKTANGRSPRLD